MLVDTVKLFIVDSGITNNIVERVFPKLMKILLDTKNQPYRLIHQRKFQTPRQEPKERIKWVRFAYFPIGLCIVAYNEPLKPNPVGSSDTPYEELLNFLQISFSCPKPSTSF